MRCFRLSHAGVILDNSYASLVVDPGSFSTTEELAAALSHVSPPAGVVITHEHPDHWLPDHLEQILERAPGCPIFTTQATATALAAASIPGAHVVASGDSVMAGPFELQFYGGTHEVIHSSIPVIENVGVRVNRVFAYGGDSLVPPPFATEVLGVPIGAPWSNVAQVMDFVLAARPRRAYLTHDGMLSAAGHALFSARVRDCLDTYGGELLDTPSPTDGNSFAFDM